MNRTASQPKIRTQNLQFRKRASLLTNISRARLAVEILKIPRERSVCGEKRNNKSFAEQ